MSSKDIKKKFVGQPIFKQLIDFIAKNKFDFSAKKNTAKSVLPCLRQAGNAQNILINFFNDRTEVVKLNSYL